MSGIVIIGAGECGVRAAFALREQGYADSVTLIGAETALPYERPPLSKTHPPAPKPIRNEASYAEATIDLIRGTPVVAVDAADRLVRFEDGTSLGYDKLVLATGARARLFPSMAGCLTLRTDADAARIMRHITDGASIGIVGGGFIGLELAATVRSAGAEVTVVEAGPRILGRAVPPEIATVVRARHERESVKILTGIGVASASASRITLADSTGLDFDIVISGVGSQPNTVLAEAASLRVDNGIVVDHAFRTSDPYIFAAGDCCNFQWRGQSVRLESWRAAQDQGAHVAAAMLGAGNPYTKVPWFWSDQFDLTLQVAGLFDLSLDIHRRETPDNIRIVFQCDADGWLTAGAGIGPGNAIAKDIRIFEKLIERGTQIEPGRLVEASLNLRSLLKAA